ncbi:MAG: hypothetical protein R2692_04920 [Microbacterium sp.]
MSGIRRIGCVRRWRSSPRFAERSFTDRHRDAAAERRVRVVPGSTGVSDLIATLPTVIADGILDRLTQQAQIIVDAREPGNAGSAFGARRG